MLLSYYKCNAFECNNLAKHACQCSSDSLQLCDDHFRDHMMSGGTHIREDILMPVTWEEIAVLNDQCSLNHQLLIKQALSERFQSINCHLEGIKNAESKCASILNEIMKNFANIKEALRTISNTQLVPVKPLNPFASFMIELRQTGSFSVENIKNLFFTNPERYSLSSNAAPPSWEDKSPAWKLFKSFNAHDNCIKSLAISDCEKFIASGSNDSTVKVWNIESGDLLYSLQEHRKSVNSISFMGKYLVSASSDREIKIWKKNKKERTLRGHTNEIFCLSISRSQKLIASGSADRTVNIWNKKKLLFTLSGHSDWVYDVAFSPSDLEIASASKDCSIKIWKTRTGEFIRSFRGHSNAVRSVFFFQNLIISGSDDKTIKIWRANTGEVLNSIRVDSEIMASGDIGSLGVFGCLDSYLRIWRAEDMNSIHKIETNAKTITAVKILSSGNAVAFGNHHGKINIWKLSKSS